MLHVLNKTNTTIQPFMIFFFISKSAKKIRSVSKEDTNQFLILKKKFRSASNEDADQFLI